MLGSCHDASFSSQLLDTVLSRAVKKGLQRLWSELPTRMKENGDNLSEDGKILRDMQVIVRPLTDR